MRHRRPKFILLLLTLIAICVAAFFILRSPKVSGPLEHDVYVWQRGWGEPVIDSLRQHDAHFRRFVVLGAQLWWTGEQPHHAKVEVDWPALARQKSAIALALRINAYRGSFAPDAPAGQFVAQIAGDLLLQARSAGVNVTELQLDFDAAESQLEGYRQWVQLLRTRLSPVPVVITALPSWLDAPAFKPLAQASGQYVLQVHSLENPRLNDRMTLCDTDAARRSIARAGDIGVSFRVALPTYGYLAGFSRDGKFLGLWAEGPQPAWPVDAVTRRVDADPAAIASLVRDWTAQRPACMTGLIWYRLPISTDRFNWRWPTLAAAMAGRAPTRDLRAEISRDEQGIVHVELHNAGQAHEPAAVTVVATVATAAPPAVLAAGGASDFAATWTPSQARFAPAGPPPTLGAGDRLSIGWIKCGPATEVTVYVLN